MFNWCQSVRIYSVEKHYHFYPNRDSVTPRLGSLSHNKPIASSVSTSANANSKAPFKKGLLLFKEVDASESLTKRTNTQ
jgi:hypothetical protein